jgi:hypothetical protein
VVEASHIKVSKKKWAEVRMCEKKSGVKFSAHKRSHLA